MTVIRNCGLLMHQPSRRWLFPSEVLAPQGFPAADKLVSYASHNMQPPPPLCSFNVDRQARGVALFGGKK
eukprot:315044-Prorocentrum_lima.AAC.1